MKITASKIGITASIISLLLVNAGAVFADDHPYGWSPQTDFSNQGPPQCGSSNPDKAPVLLQPNHPVLPKKPKAGEVVLYWHKVPGANGYSVYYGFSPKNYIFSAPDVGDTDNLVVRFLPNKVLYFAVQARNGCAAGPLSREWSARPGRSGNAPVGGTLGVVTGFQPVQRTVTPVISPEPTVEPTTKPQVQGISTEKVAYVPPVVNDQQDYNPPVAVEPPPAKPVAPKQKSLWETIISLFTGR